MDGLEKSLEEAKNWHKEAKGFTDSVIAQSLNQARQQLEDLETSSQQWEEKMRQIGLPAEVLEQTIKQHMDGVQKSKEKRQREIERLEALLRDRVGKE